MGGLLPSNEPATRLGALRAATLGGAASIGSPRFWRLVYWLLARRLTIRTVATLLRIAERLRPGSAQAVLTRAGQLLVQSGWPNQSRGWVNLDMSRFVARTEQALVTRRRATPSAPRTRLDDAIRLGVLGQLGRPLIFSHEHFRALPDGIELHVFDIAHKQRHAGYLAHTAARYTALPSLVEARAAQEVAGAVNAAALDVLVFLSGPGDAYELIDALETPCIGFVTITSNLLFHERVGFQIYWQPQADYFVHDGTLFCGLSRSPMRQPEVREGFLLLGSSGFQSSENVPTWSERDPLLVFHGSLYKAARPDYLDAVLGLLQDDPSLELVLMGRDDGHALAEILQSARRHDVAPRVHYEGAFALVRTPDGDAIADTGWNHLLELLRRARLAPDPWPLGGGQSRLEAYLLGVPAAHMGVRFDAAAWGTRQLAAVEFPRLLVPELTAHTVDDYVSICRRCLYDRPFAERVVQAQEQAASTVLDAGEWWMQLVEAYADWRRARGLR